MTLWSSFFGVTYAILALIAPPIVEFGGIAGLFIAHAVWMGALAVILFLTLPADPPRDRSPVGNILAQHGKIYASPRLSAPAMGFLFYTFLFVACLTLLPLQAPEEIRKVMATGMPLISIVISLTLGVKLLSRVSAVTLVQWGYIAAIPGFLLFWLGWGQSLPMLLGGLWLASALGIVQGASFASIPELNASPQDRASASGAIAQLGNVGTTTGTPILAAVLLQGGPTPMVLIAVIACFAGIAVTAWQAMRRRAG